MNRRKTVIITGGARGIGWAAAQTFMAKGWNVAIGDVDIEQAQARAREHPGELLAVELNVRDQASVDAAHDQVARHFGGIDALVNNAGVQRWTSLAELDWEAWTQVIDVNLNGVVRCLHAAGRHMIRQGGGAVVNITSIGAERGSSFRAPYGAAKAGVAALTRTAAVEWARFGIRVNAVGPGYVQTELIDSFVSSGQLDPAPLVKQVPLGRMAEPREIAAAIYFLASEEASYITGQTLYVDGGFLASSGIAGKLAGRDS